MKLNKPKSQMMKGVAQATEKINFKRQVNSSFKFCAFCINSKNVKVSDQ